MQLDGPHAIVHYNWTIYNLVLQVILDNDEDFTVPDIKKKSF